MSDFSLVPVDYQPDFGDVSFVPVDYDPFADSGAIQQPQTQAQPSQSQAVPAQSQSLPSPISSTQPEPTGGPGSSLVGFFNQLAAPERAESEGVADLVRRHPRAAKIEGAIRLGSLLFPPLAIAGAEALGLSGASLAGPMAADWLAGPVISGAGRATAASTAARQAISEAEATLPEGISRADFGRIAGFA